MNDYQKFIAISRYARWIDEEGRRETWEETVQRYVDYITEKVKGHLPKPQIIDAITNLEVMPSMRALMTAGPAVIKALIEGITSKLVIASIICGLGKCPFTFSVI